jgi:hypothetical protein
MPRTNRNAVQTVEEILLRIAALSSTERSRLFAQLPTFTEFTPSTRRGPRDKTLKRREIIRDCLLKGITDPIKIYLKLDMKHDELLEFERRKPRAQPPRIRKRKRTGRMIQEYSGNITLKTLENEISKVKKQLHAENSTPT